MQPNFALTFSHDGIELLRRAGDGWQSLGAARFESGHFAADVTAMRGRAATLDPGPIRAKLIIPDEQVRYLETDVVAGQDDTETARAALDGATPYAPEELSFCEARDTEGRLQIAAVATQTLTEAEKFVSGLGFTPLSFVAAPATARFPQEPFFGRSQHARRTLGSEEIEAEAHAIDLSATLPLAAGTEDRPDAPAPEAASDSETAPPEPLTEAQAGPAPAEHAQGELDLAKNVPEPAPADADAPETAQDDPGTDTDRQVPEAPLAPPESTPASQPPEPPVEPPLTAERGTTGASAAPDLRASRDQPAPEAAPVVHAQEPAAPAPVAPEPSKAPAPSLASTAEATPAAAKVTAKPRDTGKAAAQPPAASRKEEAERLTIFGARKKKEPPKRRLLGLILTVLLLLGMFTVAALAATVYRAPLMALFQDEAPAATPDEADEDTGGTATPAPDAGQAPETLSDTPPLAASEAPHDSLPGTTSARETALPRLPAATVAPRGLGQGARAPTAPALARLPRHSVPPPRRVAPEMARPASPAETRSRYATTGIWQRAPLQPALPVSRPLDPVSVANVPLPQRVEVLRAGLPPAEDRPQPGQALQALPNPPAADQRFDLDDRGLVRATPRGALTPSGVIVVRGSPDRQPPEEAWPRAPAQSSGAGATDPDSPVTEILTQAVADAQIAAPVAAAEDTPPEEASEAAQAEEALTQESLAEETNPGPANPVITRIQPRARPEALVAALIEANAAPPEPEGSEDDPSALALRPIARPADFAAAVAATQDALRDTDELDEPALAAHEIAHPRTPTPPDVARQATETRGINMRRVSLIGVFGKASSRAALVRMPGGNVQRVRVGDGLDGGRVAAIGDNALRYIKGNRNVLLEMP